MAVDNGPAAADVGPFAFPEFLAASEAAIGTPNSSIHVTALRTGAVALVDDAVLRFAGPAHLTDYHTPLGTDPEVVARALAGFSGRPFALDSLPEAALGVVVAAMDLVGADHRIVIDESTAVLALPSSYDAWLQSIGKKERHEVRRKRRRFEADFGEIRIQRGGADAVPEFCRMHRSAPGAKGTFMTAAMERFFTMLAHDAGATVHRLVCGGRVRAAAFGFETPDGYFYYNSAYDPDAAMASPGIVLLSSLIDEQIRRGARVFDFLKGDERYKYRHGAEARPLSTVEGVVP